MTAYDAVPAPWELPVDYARSEPTREAQREAMRHLAGQTAWADLRWPALVEGLVRLGRTDVPLSRLVEGHVDALRILREAGAGPEPDALYGVWASRSRATGVTARRTSAGWELDGTLEFTSGAGVIDRALVPVWPVDDPPGDDGADRGSVLLDLPVADWAFDDSRWRTRAMELSRTHRVVLDHHLVVDGETHEVGPRGWYLSRAGFFPGGIGVAAVWAGGAARLADLLDAAVPATRRKPAQQERLGRVRTDVASGLALCRVAGRGMGSLATSDAHLTAALVRSGVTGGVRRVLDEARTLAGPVGMSADVELTRAIDDLTMYVAQHNADADATWLGESP